MDISTARRPILVIGPPRSGTTWIARILASATSVCYLHEPDNEKLHPTALHLKQRFHRFPYLRVNEHSAEFETLWRLALQGSIPRRPIGKLVGRLGSIDPDMVEADIQRRCSTQGTGETYEIGSRLTRWQTLRISAAYVAARGLQELGRGEENNRRLVKSVHSVLALPWIVSKFDVAVIVVRRHPLAVAASYLRMGLPDADRNLFSQQRFVEDWIDKPTLAAIRSGKHPLQRIGYQLAAIELVLESYTTDASYVVINHEDICKTPVEEFGRLFRSLDLRWTPAIEQAISDSNREGSGFSTQRIHSREIGKWRRELDAKQLRVFEDCFLKMGVPQTLLG